MGVSQVQVKQPQEEMLGEDTGDCDDGDLPKGTMSPNLDMIMVKSFCFFNVGGRMHKTGGKGSQLQHITKLTFLHFDQLPSLHC